MAEATCKTCPFFSPNAHTQSGGNCMRNPPLDVEIYDGIAHGAFPVVNGDVAFCGEHPALQRDRLAAMAMQGICGDGGSSDQHGIAKFAYAVADAMLAEREGKKD